MHLSLPNILTLGRILMLPALVFALMTESVLCNWVAFWIYTLAAISDYLDGYFARAYGGSKFGAVFDPIADKMLVAAVLLMLVARGEIVGVHVLPALFILLRELMISGLREGLAGKTIHIPVTFLAKIKTTLQLLCLGFLITGDLAADAFTLTSWIPATLTGLILLWASAAITLVTATSYLLAALPKLKQMD